MRSRSNISSLADRVLGGTCGAIMLVLLISSYAGGYAQQPLQGAQAAKTLGTIDVPYWGNTAVMEKLAKAPFGSITDISTLQEGSNLVVSVSASCQPSFEEFRLNDPPRLVVDFFHMENRTPSYRYAVGNSGIRQMRVAQFQGTDPAIARLVFDLNDGLGNYEIVTGSQGMRITFGPGPAAPPGLPPAAQPAPRTAAADAAKSGAAAPATGMEMPKTSKEAPKPSPVPVAPKTVPPPAAVAAAQPAIPRPPQKADPVPAKAESKPEVAVSGIPIPAAGMVSPASLATATTPPVVKGGQGTDMGIVPQPAPAVPAVPPAQGGYAGHPLTLDLVNFSLVDFFRLMAEEGGINIVVDPDVKGTASIKMTKAPWDQIFEVVLRNNGLEKQVDGNVVRIATKKTIQAEAKQVEDLKKAQLLASDLETRVRRLNYAKTKMLITVLKDQMSVRGTIVEDERSGSLVLTDVPDSLDRIIQLIDMLDMPEPQVEIEARIVSATRDFARDIGVQFGFVQGNLQRVTAGGPNTFGTIGGTRPSATPTNTYIAGNPQTGRGASQSTTTESGGVSTGPGSLNNSGNYNVNLPSKLPFGGIGLSVGNILDTFLLDAAITAGESKGQAKLISQPKLTTQNNSSGVITQGLRFPVQVLANNTVTVQFQNAALTLTVTPQITADGNIVLDLKVENNTPDFTRQVQGIPSIRTSESSTRVLVKDGGTTVIGGIIIDNETTQEDRVPGLASLPILGNLFKRNSTSHSSQEILFFITPRVAK